ncbi:MAG: ABC transporter permease [Verrucomicrobiales bacterium]
MNSSPSRCSPCRPAACSGWFSHPVDGCGGPRELFRLPVVIKPGTYVFGAAVILVAMLASTLIIRYRIAKLDLVSALKYKE